MIKTALKLFKYRVLHANEELKLPEFLLGYKLVKHKPRLLKLAIYQQNPLLVLFWLIISFGRIDFFFLLDKDQIVHSSYVSPKVYRFPFMNSIDIQIGPCETNSKYQRKGIYTEMLGLLIKLYSQEERNIWIYTNLKNIPSQKAIIKSGFVFHALVKMSRFTRIIKL